MIQLVQEKKIWHMRTLWLYNKKKSDTQIHLRKGNKTKIKTKSNRKKKKCCQLTTFMAMGKKMGCQCWGAVATSLANKVKSPVT